MPETALHPGLLHPRLAGVEFPGVDVEEKRTLLPIVDVIEPHTGYSIGIKPKVAAAGDRKIAASFA